MSKNEIHIMQHRVYDLLVKRSKAEALSMMRFNHTHWGVSCRPRHFFYPMSGFFQHRHILFSVVRPTLGPPVSILTKPYLKSLWKSFDDRSIFSMNYSLSPCPSCILDSYSNMENLWIRDARNQWFTDIARHQSIWKILPVCPPANNEMDIKFYGVKV